MLGTELQDKSIISVQSYDDYPLISDAAYVTFSDVSATLLSFSDEKIVRHPKASSSSKKLKTNK